MNNYPHPLIAREGWPFLAISGVAALAVSFLAGGLWSLPFWVIFVFVLQFFRDPARPVPGDAKSVLSPADGRIVVIEPAHDPWLNRETLKISVFMNVFNVHSNRSPVDGEVVQRWYHAGAFVNAALAKASQGHDLILTSGGVSVGEEDHIKPAVEELGSLDLWQIAIKPGKPFAYGRVGGAHFMGLPGNPVSSFVTFLLLVRPFLLKLQGATRLAPVAMRLPAHFDLPRADKRREFLRARRDAEGGLELFPNQSSGVLTSAAWGDGLVDNPPGTTITKGDLVSFLSFAELLA